MSDEQVKGIAELKTSAEKRANYRKSHGEHLNRRAVFELLDDIDTLEQALAALEGRNAELKAALRRLIGACVRPNGMLQPPDVDSEYAARAALAAPDGQKEK